MRSAPLSFLINFLFTFFQTRCGTVRSTETKSKIFHTLDVTGPILPNTLHGLCQLFQKTQPDFSIGCSVHEPSGAFNVTPEHLKGKKECEVTSEDLQHQTMMFGVAEGHVEYIKQLNKLDKKGIREIKYRDQLYDWSI